MILPPELTPTETVAISLLDGAAATLPLCRPVFNTWNGVPVSFDYGKKPILDYKGGACFAELVILRILMERGWNGVWVETYGGTHYLRTMPSEWALKSEHVSIPEDKEAILKKIWSMAKTTACFDVFAWNGEEILFCEAKRTGKDKLTDAQVRFIGGALESGVAPESLLIVEWSAN